MTEKEKYHFVSSIYGLEKEIDQVINKVDDILSSEGRNKFTVLTVEYELRKIRRDDLGKISDLENSIKSLYSKYESEFSSLSSEFSNWENRSISGDYAKLAEACYLFENKNTIEEFRT